MRHAVFEAAANAGISLIFTNNSAWSRPDPRARFEAAAANARRIMASHGGRTVFVRLTAPQSALEERVANESRQAHDKLVDVGRLRELLADFDASPLHPDDLVIDTGRIEPGRIRPDHRGRPRVSHGTDVTGRMAGGLPWGGRFDRGANSGGADG